MKREKRNNPKSDPAQGRKAKADRGARRQAHTGRHRRHPPRRLRTAEQPAAS